MGGVTPADDVLLRPTETTAATVSAPSCSTAQRANSVQAAVISPTNGRSAPSSAATAARSSSGRSPSYLSSTCTFRISRAATKPPPTTAELSTVRGSSLETRTARVPMLTVMPGRGCSSSSSTLGVLLPGPGRPPS